MPKPRRRLVEVNARWEFLRRMYPATGISRYNISSGIVVRRTENIPLYSVERLRYILYSPWEAPFSHYVYYFWGAEFQINYEYRVADARSKVVDWRGIP
ncbi:MAG: hypothetical protein QXP58_07085 [Thermoprotei archaeon]